MLVIIVYIDEETEKENMILGMNKEKIINKKVRDKYNYLVNLEEECWLFMRIETMEEALEMIDYLVKEIEFRDRIIQRLSKELREC